ncbi:MAG: hypothetical protein J6J71_02735 [Prevotella sp.]|nr:hypothetical protein [Paludibacteraceae bacterium]MBP3573505.1 hypothetical protein [Prevotella sp.]
MSKLNQLMLVFARPGCEKGAGKLCEIAADIQYLNECVIPEMRRAGIKSMTIGEIVNFARLGDLLKCGFCPRTIQNVDYINYSGRRVFFVDKAFLNWYAGTEEGKQNEKFCKYLLEQ